MTRPLISDVIAVVADWFQLSADELTGHSRKRHIVWPRHLAVYVARDMTQQSLTAIGRVFGGRDHSTIYHAINLVARDLAAEPQLVVAVGRLSEAVRSRVARRVCPMAVLRAHVHGRTGEVALHV